MIITGKYLFNEKIKKELRKDIVNKLFAIFIISN